LLLNFRKSCSICLGLLCSANALLAEKPFNWTDNVPPVEVFAPVFDKVWAATAEPEPFSSIKGKLEKFQAPDQVWDTKLLLPGIQVKRTGLGGGSCMITKQHEPTTTYSCSVIVKNENEAHNVFDGLVRLVARLRTDWAVFQPPPLSEKTIQVTRAVFTIKDQTTGGNDLTNIKLETAAEVNLFSAGKELNTVSLDISFGHIPAIAQSHFDRVSNRTHSALPSPQITSNPTGSPAATVVSFINNTAFAVELFLAGPTVIGKKIEPSETQNVTIPSGKYRIVADFPPSSNLASFYGTQDYLANFQYVYKFDASANTNGTSTGIDSEIAKLIGNRPVAALPARQVAQSGTSGDTTLLITNSTQYSLRILASGPTPGDYSILPGATQNIMVAPGSYKIAGSVPAADVLPFYGTETYGAGTQYSYRFYIR